MKMTECRGGQIKSSSPYTNQRKLKLIKIPLIWELQSPSCWQITNSWPETRKLVEMMTSEYILPICKRIYYLDQKKVEFYQYQYRE